MPQLDDKLLRLKAGLKKETRKAINQVKSVATAGMSLDTKAKNASRVADQNKPLEEELILKVVDSINAAAQAGDYYIITEFGPANRTPILKYFKAKNYVIIMSKKLNCFIISWLGSKKWRRYNLGTEAIRPTTSIKVLEEYTKILNETWKKSKRKETADWEWMNPAFGKKKIDANKLLQFVNRF